VYVTEGEKCADALAGLGLLATTSAHGSNVAHKTDWAPLAGRDVLMFPDNDEAGTGYARDVAAILTGHKAKVKIVKLTGLESGGDVFDLIEAQRTDGRDDSEIRQYLVDVCAAQHTHSSPEAAGDGSARDVGDLGILLSTVQPQRVEWLWAGRIPRGKLTIIDGDPGLGKSVLTVDLAARVSRGYPMPDGEPGEDREPAGVLILSAEDGLEDTIVPRLVAAGADLSRILALPLVWTRTASRNACRACLTMLRAS
jgi:hypothetical protein